MTVQLLELEAGTPPAGGRAVAESVPARRGEPVGEPERVLESTDPVQAVFDAEFVAIVLASAPWGEPRAEPRTVRTRVPTRARRDPPPDPRDPIGGRAPHVAHRHGIALGGTRRRPVPGARSPPP